MKMKKIIIFTAVAAIFASVGLNAQERKDSVSVQADTIIIKSTGNSADKKHVHLDFDIPFYNKIKKSPDEAVIGAMGIGTIFSDSNMPFSPQNSLEYFIYALDSHTKGNHTFSYGPGVTWRNLATGSTAMSMENDGKIDFSLFPATSVPKVSKLRIFSINCPLLYSCNFGGGFGFTLGPVVNLNASSSIVNKYSIDGEKQKDKCKNVHCNIVTVDAMFQLNLKYFSLYVKYSPMNAMDKKYWPEFTTWTFGIAPF